MQYGEFNETRNILNELEEFKKPLTKIIEKFVYGLGIKYFGTFEYKELNEEPTKEVKELIADMRSTSVLGLDTEIEVTLFKLAKLLEIKESKLKDNLTNLI